jgi:Mrp family chromosome partitioning ATPase
MCRGVAVCRRKTTRQGNPHSRFATALMRIHTALQAPHSNRKQVILVTSAQPGDDETSFCTGLARALANSRIRVLVIDADLYRPRVATAFGAPTIRAVPSIGKQSDRLVDLVKADAKSTAQFFPAPDQDDLRTPQFQRIREFARRGAAVL